MLTNATKDKLEKIFEERVVIIKKGNPNKVKVYLNVKKTADGKVLIDEDLTFYIYILPEQRKILTVPKDYQDELVIERQRKFFDEMIKCGHIMPASVSGGETFNSFEAEYMQDEEAEESVLGDIFKSISDYIKKETGDAAVSIDFLKSRLVSLVGGRESKTDPVEMKKKEEEYLNGYNSYTGPGHTTSDNFPYHNFYYFE